VTLFATLVSNEFSVTVADVEQNWETQGASNCQYAAGETGTAVDGVAFDAFIPGMRGSGACNRGGFIPGTNVIVVTNRNDSGSGSLREAAAAACPKVIVFGVAGKITNNTKLQMTDCDNWSIVGSSAPGNISIYGQTGIQMNTRGDNITIGHMVIPSGTSDDGLSFGRDTGSGYDNIAVYNSSFMWGPVSGSMECYPQSGQEITNLLLWQNTFQATAGSVGHIIINNTCESVNMIRNFMMDSKERLPNTRAPDHFHGNNVHINATQDFSRIQSCDGIDGPQNDPFRVSFVNNYYAQGPASASWAGDSGYIRLIGSTSCVTTVSVWEEGTAAMWDYPNHTVRDCSSHGCTDSAYQSAMAASAITAIHPTGYVPDSITNTSQGHIDFVTKVGQHAGARPLDQLAYISDRIAQSINAVDGVGTVSSWTLSSTVASEGGVAVISDTPQDSYDPRLASHNGCATDMPTDAAADAIQSSGLTALHEYAITCWMDSVMPDGWRDQL
jgi:hypothetical protein